MARRIQIKIWPEIVSHLPAIIPIDRVPQNKTNHVDIDFRNVCIVDSSGLTILLLSLIKNVKNTENHWDGLPPKLPHIHSLMSGLNFYSILIKNVPNYSLFWQEKSTDYKVQQIEHSTNDANMCSYPIYELQFSNYTNRRDKLIDFKKHLIDQLFFLHEKYNIELNILILILIEIAKNSADHTTDNAYFGLDIVTKNKSVILKFSFADLGIGINNQVREFIKNDPAYKSKHEHLAITDSYQYAFKIGNTTKHHSGINNGIGMSTIFSLSKQINLKLSVYDAESRGLLSHALDTTHAELRKIFYYVGVKVGFYYIGEMEIFKL